MWCLEMQLPSCSHEGNSLEDRGVRMKAKSCKESADSVENLHVSRCSYLLHRSKTPLMFNCLSYLAMLFCYMPRSLLKTLHTQTDKLCGWGVDFKIWNWGQECHSIVPFESHCGWKAIPVQEELLITDADSETEKGASFFLQIRSNIWPRTLHTSSHQNCCKTPKLCCYSANVSGSPPNSL
jgi:hypothetical protein